MNMSKVSLVTTARKQATRKTNVIPKVVAKTHGNAIKMYERLQGKTGLTLRGSVGIYKANPDGKTGGKRSPRKNTKSKYLRGQVLEFFVLGIKTRAGTTSDSETMEDR